MQFAVRSQELTCTLLPEWTEQSGVMLTWPHAETLWFNMLDEIDRVFVEVTKAIATHEHVLISCFNHIHEAHIIDLLTHANVNLSRVLIFIVPANDIWVRDHGPLTGILKNQLVLLNFSFNGWGEKYAYDLDNQVTQTLHKQGAFGEIQLSTIDLVLEGGSVDVDGAGTLLTTTSCLLAKSRNPTLSQDEISKQLKEVFGLKKILWLDHGYLAGDDTDGHIDTLARFTDPNTICYVSCSDKTDAHYGPLKKMETQLKSFTNANDKIYRLVPLPWPKAQFAKSDGHRLPASYANFLIINGAVLMPTYDDPADIEAKFILSSCFPNHEIIGIHSIPLIQWHGSLHCMTMQLPKGVLTHDSHLLHGY
jgi:agmatine deiminase